MALERRRLCVANGDPKQAIVDRLVADELDAPDDGTGVLDLLSYRDATGKSERGNDENGEGEPRRRGEA